MRPVSSAQKKADALVAPTKKTDRAQQTIQRNLNEVYDSKDRRIPARSSKSTPAFKAAQKLASALTGGGVPQTVDADMDHPQPIVKVLAEGDAVLPPAYSAQATGYTRGPGDYNQYMKGGPVMEELFAPFTPTVTPTVTQTRYPHGIVNQVEVDIPMHPRFEATPSSPPASASEASGQSTHMSDPMSDAMTPVTADGHESSAAAESLKTFGEAASSSQKGQVIKPTAAGAAPSELPDLLLPPTSLMEVSVHNAPDQSLSGPFADAAKLWGGMTREYFDAQRKEEMIFHPVITHPFKDRDAHGIDLTVSAEPAPLSVHADAAIPAPILRDSEPEPAEAEPPAPAEDPETAMLSSVQHLQQSLSSQAQTGSWLPGTDSDDDSADSVGGDNEDAPATPHVHRLRFAQSDDKPSPPTSTSGAVGSPSQPSPPNHAQGSTSSPPTADAHAAAARFWEAYESNLDHGEKIDVRTLVKESFTGQLPPTKAQNQTAVLMELSREAAAVQSKAKEEVKLQVLRAAATRQIEAAQLNILQYPTPPAAFSQSQSHSPDAGHEQQDSAPHLSPMEAYRAKQEAEALRKAKNALREGMAMEKRRRADGITYLFHEVKEGRRRILPTNRKRHLALRLVGEGSYISTDGLAIDPLNVDGSGADGNSNEFNVGRGSFTISCRFKTDAHGLWKRLVTKYGKAPNGRPSKYWYSLAITNDRPVFQWGPGPRNRVYGKTIVTDDEWHVVTAVRNYKSRDVLLFLDGNFENAQRDRTRRASWDSVGPLQIGHLNKESLQGTAFYGEIDFVQLVKRRKTFNEIEDEFSKGSLPPISLCVCVCVLHPFSPSLAVGVTL